ncbi:TIGR01440 family protein [Cytobacillus sp. FJAT-54145]|uniref:UPF0340 protein ACFYKX_14760 n=1 Tax=Cytobacillus spartinae TaxID=3299023 RepID=A0ABW6KDP2_9BACI
MSTEIQIWEQQLSTILKEFKEQVELHERSLFVIGCSTSEVIGKKIGTSGTEEVAEMIFKQLDKFKEETGVQLAFQCCEHLNRALVVEKSTAIEKGFEEVTVIPVRTAGGAMATYAFQHFKNPVVIEHVRADAGIDIGDTLIGMHLKHVAVPIRVSEKNVGSAHVTLAKTRPKLIGGARAVYEHKRENESCR